MRSYLFIYMEVWISRCAIGKSVDVHWIFFLWYRGATCVSLVGSHRGVVKVVGVVVVVVRESWYFSSSGVAVGKRYTVN